MLCCNPASVKLCQTGPQRDELAFPRNPPDSTSWRTQQPDMPPVHQRFPLLQGPSCLLHLPRCMVLQSPTQILLSTQNLSQPHQLIHPTLNTALALDQACENVAERSKSPRATGEFRKCNLDDTGSCRSSCRRLRAHSPSKWQVALLSAPTRRHAGCHLKPCPALFLSTDTRCQQGPRATSRIRESDTK
ncbi:PREDICTED: uncharacterized protein LOC102003104 isoform X2 [Chinchilla lanigera]|uniref:uncharacterized protein LOC102003104 isoform X2 n=1 Tax=Chinchilla lanigera TaxID=34839 RepID=UPI0006976FFC|nr:PREDICTED: uncharacterized protein LOC102003104 isoform X2 [Chinchilla lanigera]